jgi:uncharacterized protein (DUF1786 family)
MNTQTPVADSLRAVIAASREHDRRIIALLEQHTTTLNKELQQMKSDLNESA